MGSWWSKASTWGEPVYGPAKIYVVRAVRSGKVYIGSTRDTLSRRLMVHEAHWSSHRTGRSPYYSVFQIIDQGDYYIEELEEVGVVSSTVARKRERHYLDKYRRRAVNKRNPYRFNHELKKQQRRAIKKYHSKLITCDCGTVVTRGYLSLHKKTKKHLSGI